MTQKDLIIKWNSQQENSTTIRNRLVSIFGSLALSYPSVTKTIRELFWNETTKPSDFEAGRPCNYSDDRKILNELKNDSSISCREIARLTRIPYSTVHYILTHRLHYKCRRLRWIPHILDEHHKNARLKYSKQLLDVLQSCAKNKFKFILTGDECWFCYFTPNGCQWVKEDEEPPNAERLGFYRLKIMLCIFWNPHGIVIIYVLPKGTSMNSSIFISNILEPLNQYPANLQAKKSRRRFWLHFDNAPCHRSKVVKNYMALKKFSRAPHPPFSPDLAPSDFYLLGKVKNKTQGVHFKDEEELLLTIQSEFEKIPQDELFRVFDGWINRCKLCIQHKGDYFE